VIGIAPLWGLGLGCVALARWWPSSNAHTTANPKAKTKAIIRALPLAPPAIAWP
jgi:hypothetical protein